MLKRRIRNLAVTCLTAASAIVLIAVGAPGASAAAQAAAGPAQPAQAPHLVVHQISSSATGLPVFLEDAAGQWVVSRGSGHQFGVTNGSSATAFQPTFLAYVNYTPARWPFSDQRFDHLYFLSPVWQFRHGPGLGECIQTDSVHSGVFDGPCGSHNAGTYWVQYGGSSPRGVCANASWLVNVGITNHYNPYPYGFAMFVNSNNLVYTQAHRPISRFDQWCTDSF